MDQSIWAARGPEGETLGAVVQPLPTTQLVMFSPILFSETSPTDQSNLEDIKAYGFLR